MQFPSLRKQCQELLCWLTELLQGTERTVALRAERLTASWDRKAPGHTSRRSGNFSASAPRIRAGTLRTRVVVTHRVPTAPAPSS